MLAQRRVLSLIDLFALQGLALALSTAIVAYATGADASVLLGRRSRSCSRSSLLPWLLHRLIRRLDVQAGTSRT